jgi:murein DD-endopeptidase MepM/ murein hydrolase activator NlpD
MEPSPFLKNQEMPLKKSFSLRTLFNLFFVISLGLNVYFLVVQGGAGSVDIVYATGAEEDKSVEVQMASLNTKPVDSEMAIPVHEEEPVLTSKPINEAPAYEVKKVSFDPSAQPAGRNIQALQLKVRNSLNYTVCQEMAKSECGSFAAHLARLLAWFMDVNRNMRNGDVLNVVYERLDNEDQFKVLQLTYKSGYLKKTLDANFYKGDGMKYGGYFDRNGKEIAKRIAEKQTPIAEYIEITSLPGDFRKGRRGHSGTDFKAEVGTPIRASFEGRVRRTSWNVRANGYCIELDHPREGVITRYLHLSRVLVKRGQYVKQGEVIAESGNTGRTFAPHLHYEVRSRDKKKTVYNPFDFKYHKSYHRNISSYEVKEFQAVVSAYDALLQDNGVGVKIQAG